VAPGSAAISTLPRVASVPIGVDDADGLVRLARSEAVELAVVGPERPLADGLADALRDAGVPTFGPSRAAARIEASKAFCHDVATAAGVRMARALVCRSAAEALTAIADLDRTGDGVVVKEDGLAAGKGVVVYGPGATPAEDARADIGRLFALGDATIVVEERLAGSEASVITLADGRDLVALPAARDHKRLLDGDGGPNTGGMGAYSPLPDLPDDLVEEVLATVHRPILAELARRGTPFVGALYAGLMLTSAGPALLECNVRFGDPETQAILPRLAGPLGPVLLAAAHGTLRTALDAMGVVGSRLPVLPGATVGIVLAGGSYPRASSHGDPISGLQAAEARGGIVFHAGTRPAADGSYETDGGRVLTVVGRGSDLDGARRAAEHAADAVAFAGAQRRHDIGADTQPSAAGVAG
ncbi:MAG TPA: phosphoribosylamine--glycine ligase, partial [Candidatus Binatia bacterium]|nr:phosphoribosylamine--glycine ligase [Candidatus Binatia bacterium]